jgi:hypothetical protein
MLKKIPGYLPSLGNLAAILFIVLVGEEEKTVTTWAPFAATESRTTATLLRVLRRRIRPRIFYQRLVLVSRL